MAVTSYLHGSWYLCKKGPARFLSLSPCALSSHDRCFSLKYQCEPLQSRECAMCVWEALSVSIWCCLLILIVANWYWPLLIDIQRFYLSLQCTNVVIICQLRFWRRFNVALYNRCFYHLIWRWFYSRSIQDSLKERSNSQNTSNSRDEEDPKPRDRTYRYPIAKDK